MQNIIKSWFKYFLIIGFFGICINLLYLSIPIYMMVVYDRVLFSFSKATLYTLSVGVLISLIAMGLIDYCRTRMLGQAGNDFAYKMMPFVVKGMQEGAAGVSPPEYTRGIFDLELLRNAIVRGHVFYFLDLPWVLIYLGVLYFIHPLIGILAISGVFMVIVFQALLRKFEKKQYTIADVMFQNNADLAGFWLRNAQLVSGMGMLATVMEKYRAGYKKVMIENSRADAFQSGTGAVVGVLYLIVMAGVFGLGAFVFFTDEITIGVILASVIIVARLFSPFERSLSGMKASLEAMAAYKRLENFINTREEKEKLSLPVPEGRFDAESVSLALAGKTILHNISFSLEPGESLGIFGPSAAGKTSLCKVLLGIWPAMAGKIRLDKAEIAQWSRGELGKYVGYLPQEPELFPGTVAENISRFMEADSEKIVSASQKAGVHEMILKLPQGYDTKIDHTGRNLSGGQRQLIGLARALYGDPKLVILDEPHTFLDDQGLAMVFHALNNLKQDEITSIVVTDRPNLLVNRDKLLLIKEGQVAMYGPGKEVLNQLAKIQQPQQAAGV